MKHIFVVVFCPNCEESYIIYANVSKADCNSFVRINQSKYYSGYSYLHVHCLPLGKKILF